MKYLSELNKANGYLYKRDNCSLLVGIENFE